MLHFSLLERGVCSAERRRRRFLQGKQDRKCKRISSRFNFLIMTDCILEAGAFMVACHELLCHTDSYIGKKLSAVFMQSTPKCTDSQFGQCTFMKLKNLYIFFNLPPPPFHCKCSLSYSDRLALPSVSEHRVQKTMVGFSVVLFHEVFKGCQLN